MELYVTYLNKFIWRASKVSYTLSGMYKFQKIMCTFGHTWNVIVAWALDYGNWQPLISNFIVSQIRSILKS